MVLGRYLVAGYLDPRNLIEKPLVLYWVLNRNPTLLGNLNQRFLNQVPTLLGTLGRTARPRTVDARKLQDDRPLTSSQKQGGKKQHESSYLRVPESQHFGVCCKLQGF